MVGTARCATLHVNAYLLLAFATTAGMAAPETPRNEWNEATFGRWKELSVPRSGKPGFTLLPSQQTGVHFVNRLDSWASAANRTLENGSGVALGDYDQDGWLDIFFCSLEGASALYRNLGAWRFEDVTADVGIDAKGMTCRGAVFADIDGDRRPDLLVSTLGDGVLCFRNREGRDFVDITTSAGLRNDLGGMTLALADIDGNGTLDLFVANYRRSDIRDEARIDVRRIGGEMQLSPRYRDRLFLTASGQVREWGEPNLLYRNDGRGHFAKLPWHTGRFLDEAGKPLPHAPRDWSLTATFRDANDDGAPDLYVCNDYWTPDRFWMNQGDGAFRAIDRLAIRHTSENSMGVDFADLDRDGDMDFLVLDMLSRDPVMRRRQVLAQTPVQPRIGEISNRPQIMRNTLFSNHGDGAYAEIADFAGLPASDWSWQPLFIDVDLDGWEDILIPAGHRKDVQDLDATLRIQALQRPRPSHLDRETAQAMFTREIVEHSRLYPPLPMPVIAYRNQGGMRFRETTSQWGTDQLAVHQGSALGDLDGDGDLDLVVNNLNSPCGLYRNESSDARVAVLLRGIPPNTAGVGAKVRLFGGAVPEQRQEVVSGGRYLSGSAPMLVFAAGSVADDAMSIEVEWRGGKRTTISGVVSNRLYEVDEARADSEQPQPTPAPETEEAPLFEDVTDRLRHVHTENIFDDFFRQPLLPRRLSQPGPGVCWFDLNSDGHEDLILGSGGGGRLRTFLNPGNGRFQEIRSSTLGGITPVDQTSILGLHASDGSPLLLVALSDYEAPTRSSMSVKQYSLKSNRVMDVMPLGAASAGPMAAADVDGNGGLEVFVGGRVIPGRYPEPASSRIFTQKEGQWIDYPKTEALLKDVGMVRGAVWSDLENDGFPELILACEWGSLKVFLNKSGQLSDATEAWGFAEHAGLWAGVTTGDFDGDGRLDIVAGNWGRNSRYQASRDHPLALFHADFFDQGGVDLIETEYHPITGVLAPYHRLDELARALPFLQGTFTSHHSFAEASLDEVLEALPVEPTRVNVTTLDSLLFLNRGERFEPVALPMETQLAPTLGLQVADYDGDGAEDLFLSQNFFALPWTAHRLDAGRGLLLLGNGQGGFTPASSRTSGIRVYGEQRGVASADFDEDGRVDLVVTQNGARTRLFRNRGGRPGLRVRLEGPKGNPTGVGSSLRLLYDDHQGPIREIHGGSGYLSQESAVQVLGLSGNASELEVRWPGGLSTIVPIPERQNELVVPHPQSQLTR